MYVLLFQSWRTVGAIRPMGLALAHLWQNAGMQERTLSHLKSGFHIRNQHTLLSLHWTDSTVVPASFESGFCLGSYCSFINFAIGPNVHIVTH